MNSIYTLNLYKINEKTNTSEFVRSYKLPITIPEVYDLARNNYGAGKYRIDVKGGGSEVIQSKSFNISFLTKSALPKKVVFIENKVTPLLFRTYSSSVDNDTILEEALANGWEKDQVKITEYNENGVVHVGYYPVNE